MIKIAPSILSADFADLKLALAQCKKGGADYIHVDVMDGHFVPNITIGPPVIKSLKKRTEIPLDVHLMIENPDQFIPNFSKAGANIITVHQEVSANLHETVQLIKEYGPKVGISLNPETPVSTIEHVLEEVDLILIMSVNPGFGGQKFIPATLEKIVELDHILKEKGLRQKIEIEVDGGVKLDNAAEIVNAGVDVLVAGSVIFLADDPVNMIEKFRNICQ